MYQETRFLPAGDKALVVEFGNEINEEINRLVRRLYLGVQAAGIPGIEELIPSYRSLLVYYDPAHVSIQELAHRLRSLIGGLADIQVPKPKITVLPVCYEPEYGPDLDYVAEYNGLTRKEVINIHTQTDYMIYMLGFSPGFPYLGNMSNLIATPRLTVPRKRITAGSVGIAGAQTGVYPVDSPGGWRIIGRTPLNLYDPARTPAILLSAGDWVRFVQIGREEYLRVKEKVNRGTYAAQAPVSWRYGG